jgi:hypothetical protein
MTITKYKISNGVTTIDFATFTDASNFILANPIWVGTPIIEYEEEIEQPDLIVPNEVPTWRLRAVLALDSKETDVQNAIDTLPEPNKTIAQRAWDFGSNTERTSQTVAFIKGVLSLTDAQVDDYFIQANNLQA